LESRTFYIQQVGCTSGALARSSKFVENDA
jgi:hypothetical protein